MNDLISRQAALEKVRSMQTYKLFMGDDMILIDKADVQTELMMLPTVQPEPQWIPVSEKLPEESGWYICTCRDGVNERVTFLKWQKRLKQWEKTGTRSYWKVIAWMPLPEPYKSNNE